MTTLQTRFEFQIVVKNFYADIKCSKRASVLHFKKFWALHAICDWSSRWERCLSGIDFGIFLNLLNLCEKYGIF